MLCISGDDIINAVSRTEVMDTVEETMRNFELGAYLMPQRAHVERGEDALLLMPCFGEDMFGTKLVTVFPKNAERGLPVVDGAVLLNDGATGEVLAMLNGRVLTGLRTGAVGGVSVRHFAAADSRVLGVVGAGVQGYYQALFAATAADLEEIWIFDILRENAEALSARLAEELPGCEVYVARDSGELLREADVIITATTSREPVIPGDPGLFTGKHFVGVGSFRPDMREFPAELFGAVGRVFVDTEHAKEESGDICVPLERGWVDSSEVQTLGSFLAADECSEPLRESTTLFKTVGMAAFDLTVSQLVYENADRKEIGQRVLL